MDRARPYVAPLPAWRPSDCKYVVHKECYTTGGHSCAQVREAQRTKPFIFLAADESDRERWISNLAAVRDSIERTDDSAPRPTA